MKLRIDECVDNGVPGEIFIYAPMGFQLVSKPHHFLLFGSEEPRLSGRLREEKEEDGSNHDGNDPLNDEQGSP